MIIIYLPSVLSKIEFDMNHKGTEGEEGLKSLKSALLPILCVLCASYAPLRQRLQEFGDPLY